MADEVMAEDAEVKPLQSPNLLLVLRDAQAQHGLRHGDYARYRCVSPRRSRALPAPRLRPAPPACGRQYCARRLLRLYKMLGFSHGGCKTKYQNRVLTASDVTDGRCVALPKRLAKKPRLAAARAPQTAACELTPTLVALLFASCLR